MSPASRGLFRAQHLCWTLAFQSAIPIGAIRHETTLDKTALLPLPNRRLQHNAICRAAEPARPGKAALDGCSSTSNDPTQSCEEEEPILESDDKAKVIANSQYGTGQQENEGTRVGLNDAESSLLQNLLSQRWWPTPSAALEAALRECRYDSALPTSLSGSATDLSHIHTRKLESLSSDARKVLRTKLSKDSGATQLFSGEMLHARSVMLPRVLAAHLRHFDSVWRGRSLERGLFDRNTDHALLEVYNQAVLEYLSAREYDVEDVMVWSWVITAPTSQLAVARLLQAVDGRCKANVNVPVFVLLFLLRRPAFDAHTLRSLIQYAWTRLYLRQADLLGTSKTPTKPATPLDGRAKRVMVIRLIRHALQTWPSGLPTIAEMLCYSSNKGVDSEKLNEVEFATLTFWYNRVLRLLSPAPAIHPYVSVSQQQRAQFLLLRKMTEFEPPLPVNREGYRAVVRVQLRHRKTPAERQWAEYKARSWPPWKEEKLGIDAERGNEGSTSRAMQALLRMKAAGYRHQLWEKEATFYAGWDIDGTPAIQRRQSLRAPQHVDKSTSEQDPRIWAARIRTTRTAREAWACFLEYAIGPCAPHAEPYLAMFEKLLGPSHVAEKSLSVPGDGKEVSNEPVSPQEVTYVPSEPPDAVTFFHKMLAKGIKPTVAILSFLLQHATTLESGLVFLRSSKMPERWIQTLLPADSEAPVSEGPVTWVPDSLFSSFIKFLCKFSFSSGLPVRNPPQNPVSQRYLGMDEESLNASRLPRFPNIILFLELLRQRDGKMSSPLAHALRLTGNWHRMRSRLPAVWCALLQAVAGSQLQLRRTIADRQERLIFTSKVMAEIIEWMRNLNIPSELEAFHILCSALDSALTHGYDVKTGRRLEAPPDISIGTVPRSLGERHGFVTTGGVETAKRLFNRLVSSGGDIFDFSSTHEAKAAVHPNLSTSMPALLHVPAPAHLHGLIRILCRAEDFQALVSLLRWMKGHAFELKQLADQTLNGARMMRKCFRAVRYYMEDPRSLRSPDGDPAKAQEYPEVHAERLQEAFEIIESVKDWGGWPDDEESSDYVEDAPVPLEPSAKMQDASDLEMKT